MSEDTAVLKAILSELKKITALPKYKFEEEEEDEVSGLGALFGYAPRRDSTKQRISLVLGKKISKLLCWEINGYCSYSPLGPCCNCNYLSC